MTIVLLRLLFPVDVIVVAGLGLFLTQPPLDAIIMNVWVTKDLNNPTKGTEQKQ